MKKHIGFLLVLVLLFVCGCSNSDGEGLPAVEAETYKRQILSVIDPSELTLSNDRDGGWCLINGPLYIAPYSQLSFDQCSDAYGVYTPVTMGNMAHIESVAELGNDAGEFDTWLQVTLEPRSKIKWPALWIRLSDVLEYNEENRAYYTGPFEYKDGINDPLTGNIIQVQVSGVTLTEEEVNRGRDMYICFESQDFEVKKEGLCGRDKGIAQILWVRENGFGIPGQHISLDDLKYPEYEEYSSFIFEKLNEK